MKKTAFTVILFLLGITPLHSAGRLEVSSGRTSYVLGEPVIVEISIVNGESSPMSVDLNYLEYESFTEIHIHGGDYTTTVTISPTLLGAHSAVPSPVALPPGGCVSVTRRVVISGADSNSGRKRGFYVFGKPGTYSLWATTKVGTHLGAEDIRSSPIVIGVQPVPAHERDAFRLFVSNDDRVTSEMNLGSTPRLPDLQYLKISAGAGLGIPGPAERVLADFKEILAQHPESVYAPYAQFLLGSRYSHEGSREAKRLGIQYLSALQEQCPQFPLREDLYRRWVEALGELRNRTAQRDVRKQYLKLENGRITRLSREFEHWLAVEPTPRPE